MGRSSARLAPGPGNWPLLFAQSSAQLWPARPSRELTRGRRAPVGTEAAASSSEDGTVTAPHYIYDPTVIAAALAGRAHLRGAIGNRMLAEAPAAFPRARSCPWQISRILGATDRYPGTGLLADDLERCLAAGLTLRWLRTTSRRQLGAGLAEVRTACEFLRHGFILQDLDTGKSQSRVPEFAARDGELEIAVEVYAPREWQRLTDLTDELADRLRHLDVPMDYDIELVVGPMSRLDDEGGLASLHPGPVDRGLDEVRDGAVASVMERIHAGLLSGRSVVEATHVVASLNLKIRAVLAEIRPASGPLPQREFHIHRWPASGYAPEGIFDRLARRRVRHKMSRGQAAAARLATSLLMVDLTQIPLADEWDYDFYRGAFARALEHHVAPDLMRHDAVAFCDAFGPEGRLRLHFLVLDDAAPDGLIALLHSLGRNDSG
jgi:hypothetical protein